VIEMCRALRRRAVDSLIATTNADGRQVLPVELGRAQEYQGVTVIFFRRQFSVPFDVSGDLAVWLDAHVADFDVVHIHAVFSHSSVVAARACRRHRVPYLVRPLGSLAPANLAQRSLRKRLFLRSFGRRMFSGASAIAYTTHEERRLAEQALALRKGLVLPLGIEDERLDAPAMADLTATAPYILSLSRLAPRKGLEVLIAAFGEACQGPGLAEWRLVIAGDGEETYVRHLKRLGGAHRQHAPVTFPGWVSGERKERLLRGASLFALPSFHENFGLAVMEAMACGVPALVSPGVNLASEIRAAGAGWIVEQEEPAVRDALAEIMMDANDRARRGAAARRFAGRFRWTAVVEEMIAGYEYVIEQARQSKGPELHRSASGHTSTDANRF
jgi:glycosyltransferase involved in cell wall biosynthesis